MNAVLMLTRNNIELTNLAIYSVESQNIPTDLMVIDNDSTDATVECLESQWIACLEFAPLKFSPQIGVSAAWNVGLKRLFCAYNWVLVINNDVILPPWYYRCLLSYDLPLVSGCALESWEEYRRSKKPESSTFNFQPDFSAFLIRKDCWLQVGQFDERMVLYASDCDYNVRCQKAGLITRHAQQLFYYHDRSSTIRKCGQMERDAIQARADADREAFRMKWGFPIGGIEYNELFRGEPSLPLK